MKTRAAIHLETGQPIIIDEIELPPPGPQQVLIKLFASGICHSQLHQLHDPNSKKPELLGHEGSGVVLATGSEVTHVAEGDHVLTTWLPRDAQPGQARPQRGTITWRGQEITAGAFTWAEATLADQQLVVKMDKDVPTDVTSIIGCAVQTGCGAAVNTAQVTAGSSVAVYGVGGVGLCIVQASKNLGADPIIAIDVDDAKLAFAQRFGATVGINAAREDPVQAIRRLTDGGADFAFDAIGRPQTIQQVLPSVRAGVGGLNEGGVAVLVGFPPPGGESVSLNMVDLWVARTYRGSMGGSARADVDFPRYLQWYREGKLPLDLLVTQRFRLDEANEAAAQLEAGKIGGRAIFVYDGA